MPVTLKLAMASCITGLLGVGVFSWFKPLASAVLCGITSLVAIVTGYLALRLIRKSADSSGKGLAITGIVLGFVAWVCMVDGLVRWLGFYF